MAIWDDEIIRKQQESNLIESTADTQKCPSCAANIYFNPSTQKLVCPSCGKTYLPGQFELTDILLNSVPSNNTTSNETEDDYTRYEITCNSCGASVIADKNTSASFCVFCGSPTLIKHRLSGSYLPKWVIPFTVDKENAKKIYIDELSSRKYIPKDFLSKSIIEKLTPMYVPFWLVDSTCEFGFEVTRTERIDGGVYKDIVNKRIKYKMRKVPFDGSKDINDLTMEQVQPYDYTQMVEYNPSFLQGYYAERYDENFDDLSKKIITRFRYYIAEEKKSYTEGSNGEIDYDASCTDFSCEYALLPIWFLSYEYDDTRYQIAINGQTGRISGSMPMDVKAKRRAQNSRIFFKWFGLLLLYFGLFTGLGALAGFPTSIPLWIAVFEIIGVLALPVILFFPFNWIDEDLKPVFPTIKHKILISSYIEAEEEKQYMAPAKTYIDESTIHSWNEKH